MLPLAVRARGKQRAAARNGRRALAFLAVPPRRYSGTQGLRHSPSYAHHIPPVFSERMMFLRNATAFWKPSLTLIRLSSCSMESAPS